MLMFPSDFWRHVFMGAPTSVRPVVADPIDEDDVISAHEQLDKGASLRDFGVGPLTWWRVAATCSKHGRLIRYEETVGGPPALQRLACLPCKKEGIQRSCLVDELQIVVGEKLPIVGEGENS